jgi:hypothetical protein
MQTEASLTADAMRIVVQDLDRAIEVNRTRIRKGMSVKGVNYLALVRQAHELREKAARLEMTGPLFQIVEPRPFNTGFVGCTAEQAKARGWIGVGDAFGGRTVEVRRIAA